MRLKTDGQRDGFYPRKSFFKSKYLDGFVEWHSAVALGGSSPAESYLRGDAIIAAALATGADYAAALQTISVDLAMAAGVEGAGAGTAAAAVAVVVGAALLPAPAA